MYIYGQYVLINWYNKKLFLGSPQHLLGLFFLHWVYNLISFVGIGEVSIKKTIAHLASRYNKIQKYGER